MPEEFYTSEDKVFERLHISHEAARAALKDAGYETVAIARDILGRQLPYVAVNLVRTANAIADLRASIEQPKKSK